ncbi:ABC transporter permease [uncultured Shewanella sp.]|uniref:ABC transporter permease n=1 Tax=uncultured Shewanella sp. TaxID=173975 RepID=UPI0026281BB2|nr:ABC transporter permease [uncultured Shewanella sp.]
MSRQQLLSCWLCLSTFAAHYRQSPLQAGSILTGIILAVTLLIGVRATNESAIASYGDVTELLSQQAGYSIVPTAGNQRLDESLYFDLRARGISNALAVVQGVLTDQDNRRWQVQGSDLIAALTALSNHVDTNDALSNNTQADLRPSLLKNELPLAALIGGAPIVLMSQSQAKRFSTEASFSLNGVKLEIISVDDSMNLGNRLLMDISLAQSLLGRQGKLSYIALFGDINKNRSRIEALVDGRGRLNERDRGESMTALTDSFHLNLSAMSLLAFVVGLFIAYNGVRYSLLKRQRLLTQMQQQGIAKTPLMLALCFELLILVIIGSILGFVSGLQLSHWLQPMVSVTLEQLYGANILPGRWQWSWLLQAMALTFIAALLACASLLFELIRQPLGRNSNTYSRTSSAVKTQKTQIIVALFLALLAASLMPVSRDYRITMSLLGLVVIAIPLALPWCLSQLISWLNLLAPKGLVGYQIAETKELLPPLSLAMMAMLLALTANISMNTLVGSFELTLKNWLDARLHAELYLRPGDAEMQAVITELEANPKIDTVYKQWNLISEVSNHPAYLLTRDPVSIKRTTVLKSSADQLWPKFFAGKYLLMSEPLALKLRLELGDNVTIEALGDANFTLGGIYFDYGNPYGEVILAPRVWQESGFSEVPTSLGLATGEDIETLRLELQQRFSLSDSQLYSQARIKQQAIAMFKRTFSITQVLNSLTLLVAAVGLFSACFLLTQARMAPMARLYSLGVSRRQLAIMVFSQMWLIVLLTCLVALPTGVILGYLLIHKVTLQAFGWSIDMVWDWHAYGRVVLLALLATTIAIALPLFKLIRKPLISSLQSDLL